MGCVTCVSMQGLAGDLYRIANGIEDVDVHLEALKTSKGRVAEDVYEHDMNLLLDLRRVLERLPD